MAASAIQSVVASPLSGVANRTRSGQLVPSFDLRRVNKNRTLQVRCMAEGQDGKKEGSNPAATPTPSPQPISPPPAAPKVSTKFSDVLAFSGPAPERINGRLAMVGFVSAMAVEVINGQDVLSQISNGGVPLFLGTSVLFTLASLVPLFKGVSVQSKSNGIMTSDAELWNGRFAMLGLVALAFTEYVKGSALV